MQKLANIEPFEALATNASTMPVLSVFNPVENFDRVVPTEPTPRQDNNPPNIPKWGVNLGERVGRLEGKVDNIEKNITQINQKLDKLVR